MRKVLLYIFVVTLLALSNNVFAVQYVASPKGRVVVLDAGHGGPSRPGAAYGGVNEKELNLKVTLKVKELLNKKMPGLTVHLTRSSDIELHPNKATDNLQRPKIANEKGADLFVSIHANAAGDCNTSGAEVIVLSLDGKTQGHTQSRTTVSKDNEDYIHIDNIDKSSLAYIEALSLLMNNDPINRTFGEIVGAKFKNIGRKWRGVKIYPDKVWTALYPLRAPGVIIEMGFMTNSSELQYMTSASGQTAIATAICDAIVEYFERLEQMTIKEQTTTTEVKQPSATTEIKSVAKTEVKEGYTIQLMASANQLTDKAKRFGELGSGVIELIGKGSYKYKYCYGEYATLSEAKANLERVRQTFGDAYIVQYKGNELK